MRIQWTHCVCRKSTLAPVLNLALLASALGPAVGLGQSAPDWRRIGSYAIAGDSADGALAGSVSGPVDRVWYSSDGSILFVRTSSGRTYQTLDPGSDAENWQSSENDPPPVPATRILGLPPGSAEPPGALRDLVASPANPDELTAATDKGVFRSADAAKSWTSLNDGLPNLPVVRLLQVPSENQGLRIELNNSLAAEWPPGEKQLWLPADNRDVATRARLRAALGSLAGTKITAVALSGDMLYAGTADGELRVSSDRGQTWQTYAGMNSGKVERIWTDPSDARVALAVLGATPAGATVLDQRVHVLHTINGGAVWDNLTANLPDVAAHGITADRATGAIYVATDAGVFAGYSDLASLGGTPNWTPLAGLPSAHIADVMLDGQSNQLWAAVEGFGVYATLAPHRYLDPKVVSAADLVARAVAPGSLISILGAQVSAVRAGDVTIPILSATASGSQLQVPFDIAGNSLGLVATGSTTSSSGMVFASLQVASAAPAIFVGPDATPMLLDGDSGVMLDAMTPAHTGGRVQILASGLGKVSPDWPAGLAAPAENPPRVAGTVRAFLDRTPIEVTRAVLAPGYVGLYLVEITVPKIANYGPAELYIDVGGASSNRVRVYIEP